MGSILKKNKEHKVKRFIISKAQGHHIGDKLPTLGGLQLFLVV